MKIGIRINCSELVKIIQNSKQWQGLRGKDKLTTVNSEDPEGVVKVAAGEDGPIIGSDNKLVCVCSHRCVHIVTHIATVRTGILNCRFLKNKNSDNKTTKTGV